MVENQSSRVPRGMDADAFRLVTGAVRQAPFLYTAAETANFIPLAKQKEIEAEFDNVNGEVLSPAGKFGILDKGMTAAVVGHSERAWFREVVGFYRKLARAISERPDPSTQAMQFLSKVNRLADLIQQIVPPEREGGKGLG